MNQPTPRPSHSAGYIAAAITAAVQLFGMNANAQDAPSTSSPTVEKAASGAFDGLLSRQRPTTFQAGASIGQETFAGFGRVNAFGYPVGPLLLNGRATLVGGEFFRSQDGKYTQTSAEVVTGVLYDFNRNSESEQAVFNDKVLAFGPSIGYSFANSDGFMQSQGLASVGGRALLMNGRFQADVEGRAIVYGNLDAKEGLSGEASGGLVNASASIDFVDVVEMPLGAHLVAIPRAQWLNVNRDLSGKVNGTDVSLGSDSKTFTGGLTVVGDFGRWYAGLTGQAGVTNVKTSSSFAPSGNNSFTSWGASLVGGIYLGNGFSLDAQAGYNKVDSVGELNGALAIRYNLGQK